MWILILFIAYILDQRVINNILKKNLIIIKTVNILNDYHS